MPNSPDDLEADFAVRARSIAKYRRRAFAGIKYFGGWLRVLNGWVYLKNAGYNGAPGELSTPWDRIAPRLEDWRFAQTQFGMGYLASGRVADA